MPIERSLEIQSISDHEFEEIDAVVMRCAYASQNHFGHLFDERVYENDVAARLRAEGLHVQTQVPVTVVLGSFHKTYYLDLVVNQMLYELKATSKLVPEHDMQALHYAMLQDVRLVKLINFGGERVHGKLLLNAMHGVPRRQFTTQDSGWLPLNDNCERLVHRFQEVLSDFGTHLDARLYNECLIHYFSGDVNCLQRGEVCADGRTLGSHPLQFHGPQHAFAITSFTAPQRGYRRHLEVLLRHVPVLEGLQWLNLNHSSLEITTLSKTAKQTTE